MKNKVIKILILFVGVVIFSFAFTSLASAYAYSTDPINGYNDNVYYTGAYYDYNPKQLYYEQPIVYTAVVTPTVTQAKPSNSVVNNYYYQSAPAQVKSDTSQTKITEEKSTSIKTEDQAYNPYDQGNGITALSLRGKDSFMPSSIWQWMFVVVLILAIIILARTFVNKPNPEDHSSANA
jgi:hypothetical protein